jgi:hypothetical protein
VHAPHDELGLNLITIWENYCSTAIRSCTQICIEQGAMVINAKVTLS